MYSESSDEPSSQVMRSSRSTKTRFCTRASSALPCEPASASFSAWAEAMYSGMGSSLCCQANQMLRRSTGLSEEVKRVGVESG